MGDRAIRLVELGEEALCLVERAFWRRVHDGEEKPLAGVHMVEHVDDCQAVADDLFGGGADIGAGNVGRNMQRIGQLDDGVLVPRSRLLRRCADGVQGVAQGVLRGCGMQRTIAIANLCGFWLLGVPSGFFICFILGLGVKGLWIGLILGLCVVSVILFCLVAWLDWDAAVARAVAMQGGGVQKHAPGALELVEVKEEP